VKESCGQEEVRIPNGERAPDREKEFQMGRELKIWSESDINAKTSPPITNNGYRRISL